jgi:hypothetical protein
MRGESKRIIWTDKPSTKNRRPNVLVLEPRTTTEKLTTTPTEQVKHIHRNEHYRFNRFFCFVHAPQANREREADY